MSGLADGSESSSESSSDSSSDSGSGDEDCDDVEMNGLSLIVRLKCDQLDKFPDDGSQDPVQANEVEQHQETVEPATLQEALKIIEKLKDELRILREPREPKAYRGEGGLWRCPYCDWELRNRKCEMDECGKYGGDPMNTAQSSVSRCP